MSVFDGLRRFDAFSKPQEDFRTKTVVGGLSNIQILLMNSKHFYYWDDILMFGFGMDKLL